MDCVPNGEEAKGNCFFCNHLSVLSLQSFQAGMSKIDLLNLKI